MKLKEKHSQSGFGILEAMIGIGILGIATLAFMNLMSTFNKEQGLLKYRMSRTEIRASLVAYLATNASSCSCTLKSLAFNPATLPQKITLSGGFSHFNDPVNCAQKVRTILEKGDLLENLEVTDVRLQVTNGVGSTWTGSIIVDSEGRGIPNTNISRRIVIPFDFQTKDVGSNKEIVSCGAGSSDSGISFDSTFVGDTTTPVSKTWTLTKLPPTAKAVLLKYHIGKYPGSGKKDRHDRNCTISNSKGESIRIGVASTGDGGQHFAAGTAVVTLGAAPHSLTLSCNNDGSAGYLTSYGFIE